MESLPIGRANRSVRSGVRNRVHASPRQRQLAAMPAIFWWAHRIEHDRFDARLHRSSHSVGAIQWQHHLVAIQAEKQGFSRGVRGLNRFAFAR